MMKPKKILTLVGSNNDIDDKGKPTKFAIDLDDAVKRLSSDEMPLDYDLDSCSEDRTSFFAPAILCKAKYDGIIGHGGYSLVLMAGLQKALLEVRTHTQVNDLRAEMALFLKEGERAMMFLPGTLPGVTSIDSPYYWHNTFIPTIGVPGKDSISGGVTALTSIAENPAGCEPRPVVGLNRIDAAVYCMQQMFKFMHNGVTGVDIAYETTGNDGTNQSYMGGAEAVRKRLESFGYQGARLVKPEEVNPDNLVVLVAEHYGSEQVKGLDQRARLVLNCALKRDMSADWVAYLKDLTALDHTVSVGVGNYDNAAILAAQLIGTPEVEGGMWKYRHGKTYDGVVKKPDWLKDGKVTRGE